MFYYIGLCVSSTCGFVIIQRYTFCKKKVSVFIFILGQVVHIYMYIDYS